jgi:hypothetical protein
MPQCPHCDREVAWDASFCPNCGKRKPAESSNSGGDTELGIGGLIGFGIVGGVLGCIVSIFVWSSYADKVPGTPADPFRDWGIFLGVIAGIGFGIFLISQESDGSAQLKRLLKQILWTIIVILAIIVFSILSHSTR